MATVTKRYATALFELASEGNKLEKMLGEVEALMEAMYADPDFLRVINHPQIGREEKWSIIERALGSELDQMLMGFLRLILNKNREAELLSILKEFCEMAKGAKGIVTAVVASAAPLSEERLERIHKILSQNLNKQVELVSKVDATLIGGLKVTVGGSVLDATILRQMNELKSQLLSARAE